MNRRILTYLLLTFVFMNDAFSQDALFYKNKAGFTIGANLALGTHFQRMGIVCNLFYVNDNFQANAETRFYFNIKAPGPNVVYNEAVTSLGVLFGYGSRNSFHNPFYSIVSNQTGYKFAVAYAYQAYWNTIRTSQRAGVLALQIDKITLITENDLLAPPSLDKFRTAAALVQYQHDSLFQVALNCSMWTGKMGFKTPSTDKHFYFGCYMDTTGSIYPNVSHGLLSAQMKYNFGYAQNVQANVGADAEQIRNFFQNKIIHDMRYLPKKWVKNQNCHIPMLDENGNQYLYKEDQKIRPAKFYFNWFSNAGLFY